MIAVQQSSVVVDGATVLRLLSGQLSPSTGAVTVDGSAPDPREPWFRALMAGMIGLLPSACDPTVREHTTLAGVSWGWSVHAARTAAEDNLEQLGSARLADRFPHELSSRLAQSAGLNVLPLWR